MELTLYNTLTRSKQAFAPIDPANVRMYVCGPTVYDYAHIGNARPLIVFDVLFRLLRHLYGADHVTYIRNITDVDDKINARAAEEFPDLPLNEAIRKVTTRTTEQFHADVAALGCLEPTVEPRATDYIDRPEASEDMLRLIGKLIDGGHAYAAEGHVLFDVKSWKAADGSPEYGKLSRRSLDDMIAGARVEVAPYKKDPMDFVLWKPSKPGEPAWDSPWGAGRPGWHLECSAMAGALLGDTFDIHGGGIDLAFPHHENEIAQSRCAHGTAVMANFWLHNGFLQVEGEKMSKSLGNFITIRDLLETDKFGGRSWPGEVLRLAMLRTHYRQPIDWTVKALEESARVLDQWYDVLAHLDDEALGEVSCASVASSLSDDLNTPEAMATVHKLAQSVDSPRAASDFYASLELLGLVPSLSVFKENARSLERSAAQTAFNMPEIAVLPEVEREAFGRELISHARETADPSVSATEIFILFSEGVDFASLKSLIADRATARADKNWAEADRIRDELDAMGIALKDAKDPETGQLKTTWEVKR